jgi:nitrate/TMAO reductase-like tetraheme cytochrome c subunit
MVINLTEKHGYAPLHCIDCHQNDDTYAYPHNKPPSEDLRTRVAEKSAICAACHEGIALQQGDSSHEHARLAGNNEAATCIDCHGSHDIQPPDEPREHISQTCSQCHTDINTQYEQSVHGEALLGEHNPDVPVCIDCHGVHNIEDATTNEFGSNRPIFAVIVTLMKPL